MANKEWSFDRWFARESLKKFAGVYKKDEGYFIHPMTYSTEGILLDSEPYLRVAPACAPTTLGKATLKALRCSNIVPTSHPKKWSDKLPGLLRNFSSGKTWKSFCYGALRCMIEQRPKQIVVIPYKSVNFGKYFVRFEKQFRLKANATPTELAESLHRTFTYIEENGGLVFER
jgi:hypothetical protein